jgi:D-methionine transport system ATP-binding protein
MDRGKVVEKGRCWMCSCNRSMPSPAACWPKPVLVRVSGWTPGARALACRCSSSFVGEPTLSPVLDKVGRETGLRVNLLSGTLSEIRDTPCGQLLVGVVASDVELPALPEIFAREGVRCEVLA